MPLEYNEIFEYELDPTKPLKTSLFKRLAGNLPGFAAQVSGAPKLKKAVFSGEANAGGNITMVGLGAYGGIQFSGNFSTDETTPGGNVTLALSADGGLTYPVSQQLFLVPPPGDYHSAFTTFLDFGTGWCAVSWRDGLEIHTLSLAGTNTLRLTPSFTGLAGTLSVLAFPQGGRA